MNLFRGNFLKYGTYILVLFLPIVFWGNLYYPYISTKTFFFYAVVEILFFVWLYTTIVDPTYRLNKKTLLHFAPLIVLLFWITLAGIFGTNPHYSFWSSIERGTGLLTYYHCLAFAFVVAGLVKKNGISYIYSLFQYIVVGGFFLILTVLLGKMWLDLPYSFFLMSGDGGSLGNSSLSVVYLTFVIGYGLFLLFSNKIINREVKVMIGIVVALIIFSPLFINFKAIFNGGSIIGVARGAVLSILVACTASWLIYLSFSKNKNIKIIGRIGIVMGIIFSLFLWNNLITPNTYLNKKFSESASSSRLIFWQISQNAIDKHPVLGYGPENFRIAMQENFDPKILINANTKEGWSDKPHNVFYELGVAGGYTAIVLYIIFILSLFYFLYKARNSNKINRVQISILSGLLVSYIVQNLFIFDTLPTLALLFIISAFIFSIQDNGIVKSISLKKNNKTALYVLPVIFGIICIVTLRYFVYLPFNKTILYSKTFSIPISKRVSLYPELLHGSSVGVDWDVSGLADQTFIDYAGKLSIIKNDKNALPYFAKNLEGLLLYLGDVLKINKTDYRLYITRVYLQNTLAYLQDEQYSVDRANKMFEILDYAETLSPKNPSTNWARAQVKDLIGDLQGVEQEYKDAIAMEPKVETSHKLLILFAYSSNNNKLYEQAFKQAKIDIPDFTFIIQN